MAHRAWIGRTFDTLVRDLIGIHESLPFRPFKRQLHALFRTYIAHRRNRTVEANIEGIRYQLDLREDLDATLYYRRAWEPRASATIKTFLRPGMTAIDIGANMGYFTLMFARLVGEAGRVIAFEPTTWAFEKLRKNIALNGFANVSAEQLALSDSPETREIGSGETAFRASWPICGSPETRGPELVTFLPLDLYVRRSHLRRVDFIKIDVDGNEYRVIRGALETLRRYHPRLLIEIGKWTMDLVGDHPEDLVALLADLGYSFSTEDSRRTFSNADELLEWIPQERAMNILCNPIGDGPSDSA